MALLYKVKCKDAKVGRGEGGQGAGKVVAIVHAVSLNFRTHRGMNFERWLWQYTLRFYTLLLLRNVRYQKLSSLYSEGTVAFKYCCKQHKAKRRNMSQFLYGLFYSVCLPPTQIQNNKTY